MCEESAADTNHAVSDRKHKVQNLTDETALRAKLERLTDSVQALEKDLKDLDKNFSADGEIFGQPFIRDAASEILLFAHRANCTKQRRRSVSLSSELTQFTRNLNCGGDAPVSEQEIAAMFVDIIQRSAGSSQTGSVTSLEADAVEPARALLKRHPGLRAKCPDEVLIIDNYEKIRAAFGF